MTSLMPSSSHRTNINKSPTILNIWLKRTQDGNSVSDWKVDRLVVSSSTFVNTITVTSSQLIGEILTKRFAGEIEKYLPIGHNEHVLTASDFTYQTQGLTLSCLRVTGRRLVDGVQRVMLTFRHLIGDFTSLFQDKRRPCALKDGQADASARALLDILTPALSLVELAPENFKGESEERVAQCLDRLRRNKNDLEFYSSLLTRYIHQLDSQDSVSESASFPDALHCQ